MAVTPYVQYTVPSSHVITDRPSGVNLRFFCDLFSELPTGTSVIDGDTAFAADVATNYVRTGGVWVVRTTESYAPNSLYRLVAQAAGSHVAGRVAGTYFMGVSNPIGISGTGTLYPPVVIPIMAADFPSANGLAPKLRIRGQIAVNDVAPTGNFTFGLYPITRPATSGGAALNIYTLGTVVTGSNGATVSTPAADSHSNLVGSDFALPADGLYVLGVVTTATVAVSSHTHLTAQLQMRNA